MPVLLQVELDEIEVKEPVVDHLDPLLRLASQGLGALGGQRISSLHFRLLTFTRLGLHRLVRWLPSLLDLNNASVKKVYEDVQHAVVEAVILGEILVEHLLADGFYVELVVGVEDEVG